MAEINMTEAFSRYKVKPTHGGRSAVTPNGSLVVSCWYARFKRAQPEVLRYEEELAEETTSAANTLRAHLAEALAQESDVRLVIAVAENRAPSTDPSRIERPLKTTFHARKDLLGRVTFFDGKRFVIDFRKNDTVEA